MTDETAADQEGYLFSFTTGSAGELALDLMMYWVDESQRSTLYMEATAHISVTDKGR